MGAELVRRGIVFEPQVDDASAGCGRHLANVVRSVLAEVKWSTVRQDKGECLLVVRCLLKASERLDVGFLIQVTAECESV